MIIETSVDDEENILFFALPHGSTRHLPLGTFPFMLGSTNPKIARFAKQRSLKHSNTSSI